MILTIIEIGWTGIGHMLSGGGRGLDFVLVAVVLY